MGDEHAGPVDRGATDDVPTDDDPTGDAPTGDTVTRDTVTRDTVTGHGTSDLDGDLDDGPAGHVLPDEVEYPEREDGAPTALPRRVESWRRRSATGAMLTGFAFGLREVLEPTFNEPSIVLETSGTPPKDLPVEADIDNVPPRQSVVRIRRWLLTDPDTNSVDATGTDATTVDTTGPTTPGSTTPGSTTTGTGGAGSVDGAVAPRVTEIRSREKTKKRFGRSTGRR